MTILPTPQPISDPDVALLASISAAIMTDYIDPASDPWVGSPFAWIKTRPSRQVGAIGEQLVADWCAAKGLDVLRTGDAEADRIINGKQVEVKFSTLWAGGNYVFQQIRDQRYDIVVMLGLSPFMASCWVVPKAILRELPLKPGLSYQHGGRLGRDTMWLQFHSTNPPDWLNMTVKTTLITWSTSSTKTPSTSCSTTLTGSPSPN